MDFQFVEISMTLKDLEQPGRNAPHLAFWPTV